ncbi:MAG TPA: MFS transporter [Chloroflexota bacterium]|nr:MFS transporter [Chloroflexota bacterium]
MFGALRNRNFVWFWSGAFVSNIGSWIQSIALSWLVWEITQSAIALGAVNFASTVPILALSLFGGVFVDRIDRRFVLRITQALMLVLALALAVVTWLKVVQLAHILIITFLTGVVMALNSPAWQAFIVDLVEPKDLPAAIALNSTQFNLSRVVGPSLAGVLLSIIGAAGCFFINSLSFLAVVGALFVIQPRPAARKPDTTSVWKRLRIGLDYTMSHPVLRPLVYLTSIVTIFGMTYALLMPVMAQDVLGQDAGGYGAMMSATGVGAIIGSLALASWGSMIPRGRLLIVAEFGFSASVIGFSLSRSFILSLVLLAVLGCTMIGYMTTANTAIQLTTPDDLRGRVMSIWVLVSFGFSPIGSLIAGAVAQYWGAPLALGLGGAICAVAGIGAALTSPALRRLGTSRSDTVAVGATATAR